MKENSSQHLKFNPYLEKLYHSDKPLIIYKVEDGYNLYTDFSKKIMEKYNIAIKRRVKNVMMPIAIHMFIKISYISISRLT